MHQTIWPVVTENLAEQLSAAQGGIVHPAQLLPYLPLSLRQIEQTLNALAESDRVERQIRNGLLTYCFHESTHKAPQTFLPRTCVYSNETLDAHQFTAITPTVRQQLEAELALSADKDNWPAEAVREHELIYLLHNLPAPVSTSAIAGHSQLPFKKVEIHLNELRQRQLLHYNTELNTWDAQPLRYPQAAYLRNNEFIRQFPGAVKEELEIRLIKALSRALLVLLGAFILAITAKFPFPLVLGAAGLIATFVFLKVFKTKPQTLPNET